MDLFMILLGCKPKGRNTEQHDIYFGIAEGVTQLISSVKNFWPEANGKLHADAWRKVTKAGNFRIKVIEKTSIDKLEKTGPSQKLFFINLGGYKPNEFEEFHYKLLAVAEDKGTAIMKAKQTAFYKHTGFKGANAHIDDKYGIDVDDIFEIEDILEDSVKDNYCIELIEDESAIQDELHIGYFKLDKIIG